MILIGLGGCIHAPPAGSTSGVVEITNPLLRDDPDVYMSVGVLTGVAIGERTVLTAAHTFLTDPEPGHPLKFNGETVGYSIIADGWSGSRRERASGDKLVDEQQMLNDYLFLQTAEPIQDHANLVPLVYERVNDIQNLTLVTRRSGSDEVVAIPLRTWMVGDSKKFMLIFLPERERAGLRVSGSPLIGQYPDGTLVLAGIATALGEAMVILDQETSLLEDQIYILPAYQIPFDALSDH